MNGFIIIDRETKEIDWDGAMHPTPEQAIASLTGPRHMYCKTEAEENDEKTYWKRHYMICPVGEEIAA